MNPSRRSVLTAGVALGGGLLVRVGFAGEKTSFEPNAFIRVPSEGPIHIVLAHVEMGQGTLTGTAMLIAEELEVDPRTLVVDFAPAAHAYDDPQSGLQLTGGSSSTPSDWEPLRQAGASAREMLKEAAARRFGVPRNTLIASNGQVLHQASGRSASYQALAADAAALPVEAPPLKTRNFTVIGKPLGRLDAVQKSNGSAVFGLDVMVPGALVAVLLRCPVHRGTVKSFDATAARAMPGVKHVVQVPAGVAVVAETYWHAREAAKTVTVAWDEGAFASFSTATLHAERLALIEQSTGKRVRSTGNTDARFAKGGTRLEASYELPFLAHATMEPQNATAHVTATRCEVWAPTQGPGMAREQLSRLLGLPMDAVEVHQTVVGGGFGRRGAQDYALEAAMVSKAIGGPVKVVWSREDDLRHSFYRPAATHHLRAAFGDTGQLEAWHHVVATQSILSDIIGDFAPALISGAPDFVKKMLAGAVRGAMSDVDPTSVEGGAELPYAIPNVAVDFVRHETGAPVGPWRSVGHSHNAFATESFIDECAHAAKADPFEFRKKLLARKHRLKWVLELAAEKAGWGSTPADGVGRGIAVHASFKSYSACVADVKVVGQRIVVTRLVMAIDCGRVVNPDVVRSQLESAAVFGLSAALSQRITYEQGRVQQSNFHDFAPMRLSECPVIETHLRDNPAPPTGVGEPGLPAVAPAVANAVFALTGKRLRALPLSLDVA